MGDVISWDLLLRVKDGELDNFTSLMTEMVEATKGEEGALIYEWYVADDGGSVHIYERYADNDATMVHLGNFGEHFAERFYASVDPEAMYVYGPSNDTLREALTPAGAIFMGRLGGFAR